MTTPSARPETLVHGSPGLLAAAAAARIVTTLVDAQAAQGTARAVLTGGGTGIAVLEALLAQPARDAVDWSHVDLYWGDERFLPDGHPDRNETQARAALLDHLPLDPGRVHPMPAEKPGRDVEAAAASYASLLTEDTVFDVCLLGVGEEGHVASLFPHSPAVRTRDRDVVGVPDSPKPPPHRVSLTLQAIRRSRQVWLLTAGAAKADAVAAALAGVGADDLPAAGARGTERTLWFLDRAAASRLDPASGR